MRLRPATAEDVAFLADVVIAATRDQGREPEGFDEAGFRRRFERDTLRRIAQDVTAGATYVIEVNGERAGRLRVVRDPDRLELSGIQLLPHFQSHGLGTAVIRRLMEEATTTERPLELGVEADNPRARALYARLGFVPFGEDRTEILMRWTPGSA